MLINNINRRIATEATEYDGKVFGNNTLSDGEKSINRFDKDDFGELVVIGRGREGRLDILIYKLSYPKKKTPLI